MLVTSYTMSDSTTPSATASANGRWTTAERVEIRRYAREHPSEGWRSIQRWFMRQYPGKRITHLDITNLLNAEEPTEPSDAVHQRQPEPEMEITELERALYEWLRAFWRSRTTIFFLSCFLYTIAYSTQYREEVGWIMVADKWVILMALSLIIRALILYYL